MPREKLLYVTLCMALFTFGPMLKNAGASVDLTSLTGTTAYSPNVFQTDYASLAIDGNYSTGWSAGGWEQPGHTTPKILTVTLNNTYLIDEIDLYSYDSPAYGSAYYIKYNLYVSDGSTTTTIATNQSLVDTSTGYFALYSLSSPISANTIIFEVTGGTHWAHLFEMDAYGSDIQAATTPEPTSLFLLGAGVIATFVSRMRHTKNAM